jgi:signal transduction histidine kinase
VLQKVAQLLADQVDRLPEFFAQDPRGAALPRFLTEVSNNLALEQQTVGRELAELVKNIAHIKQIVMMQQSHARRSGEKEPLRLEDLVDDALRINESAMHRHGIEVIQDHQAVPKVLVDRNRVLQILVNLIRNAKHALDESGKKDRKLLLRIRAKQPDRVTITVQDNGVGISPENLARLFTYGFTTRKSGHGFGLHSSLTAAHEMDGELTVFSEGLGHGATFTLELPMASASLPPRLPPTAPVSKPAHPVPQLTS